jgi:hypothetical protein
VIWTLVAYYKEGDLSNLKRPTAIDDLMALKVEFEIVEITKSTHLKYHPARKNRELERVPERVVSGSDCRQDSMEFFIFENEEIKGFEQAIDLGFGSSFF